MPLRDLPQYAQMSNSLFSFEAFTRIWFILHSAVPDEMRDDPIRIRNFALEEDNKYTIRMKFAGDVTILRGSPQKNPETGATQLPMSVVEMEEYGYVPELDTTFALRAQAEKPSFGMTNQLTKGIDSNAQARLLLNLEIEGISGKLETLGKQTCTTKKLNAEIPSFPFTNASTVFRHVGNEALAVGNDPENPVGHIVHGIMTPQLPLAPTDDIVSDPSASLADSESLIEQFSDDEVAFLNGLGS